MPQKVTLVTINYHYLFCSIVNLLSFSSSPSLLLLLELLALSIPCCARKLWGQGVSEAVGGKSFKMFLSKLSENQTILLNLWLVLK